MEECKSRLKAFLSPVTKSWATLQWNSCSTLKAKIPIGVSLSNIVSFLEDLPTFSLQIANFYC